MPPKMRAGVARTHQFAGDGSWSLNLPKTGAPAPPGATQWGDTSAGAYNPAPTNIWETPAAPAPAPAPTPEAPGIDWNQSAYDVMKQMLDQYSLGSLSSVLRKLIEGGITDQASVMLELQNTAE